MNWWLSFDATSYPWYIDFPIWIATFAYTIFVIFKMSQFIRESHVYNKEKHRYDLKIREGLKETFFENETHFTLYDIFRMAFIIIPIVVGLFVLLLKAGAWNLFPLLRKILGIKLFRIEKEKSDDAK